jgi:ribonucleoside-diphosphate reductase beta chain
MYKKIIHTIGKKKFVLDKQKSIKTFSNKSVINGKKTSYFNILPLKYDWAYKLYREMKANHWEPEDIPMQRDYEQWKSNKISKIEKWIIKMGIGYFSAAEGIVGDNILHVIRENITAPEIKLVLGRHFHEENIHTDSLVYMISSLGIDPYEIESMFENIKTIKNKNDFVVNNSCVLRKELDLNKEKIKKKFAKNIFLFGQCMEGMQFYGLFGMILSLYRQNKFTGIGQMFRYTLRDESNHIKLLKFLFKELIHENPEIWTLEFKKELIELMRTASKLEKNFIKDCLPINALGLSLNDYIKYIDYISQRRLKSIGLIDLNISRSIVNPFPWLSELMDIQKEQNFFEGRVTEYKQSFSLEDSDDNEL